MTLMANSPAGAPAPVETVNVTIDGVAVAVPKGTLIIRAAEMLGVAVPRFCDHPLLEPVAACRMCLVEIEGQPKPQPSCAIPVAEGMVVRTQHSSTIADEAQKGVMEFLLVNHPLDCPICDKGGECPLQNQAMSNGRPASRFEGPKREFPKPINVSAQVLLDRERCVSCARCTRFAEEIAGDPFIALLERGAQQQVGTSEEEPFDSYFSGNTIQICPVGALTSASYRFRSRPFDLVSTPTVCEHCASGCTLRTDHRRHQVTRRLAWDNPAVNEEWNCDKGRFAFAYVQQNRLTHPLVRGADGELHVASWPEALAAAAAGLSAARGKVAHFIGGRLTVEDAYAYSRFARTVTHTDAIDFRNRAASDEESQFLRHAVVARQGVAYADLEQAPMVLLVAFEPEDESPIVFLRLHKAVRKGGTSVVTLASYASAGTRKLSARHIACTPNTTAAALTSLDADVVSGLSAAGSVIMVGQRAALTPGLLSAVAALSAKTGARIAWVPRRAGERGALEVGAIGGWLPGGRSGSNDSDRAAVEQVWGPLPTSPSHSADELTAAVVRGQLTAVVTAGLEPRDAANPHALRAALDAASFVVAFETRHTDITERADVIFPVATVTEKSGSFVNWEGRVQAFAAVEQGSTHLSDARVLADLAHVMGVDFPSTHTALRREMAALAVTGAPTSSAPTVVPASHPTIGIVLDSWHELIDAGGMQEGEPYLGATARPVVARMSITTAAAVGAVDGGQVRISSTHGAVDVTASVEPGMADGVVWLPANAHGCCPSETLRVAPGETVSVAAMGGAL
ncbi:MAG: NADH-quinone oxidoreductase subunit G [Actinobacteria bacterium]|nr:NADH-quinone oxidoreductase subunit G [Actinomycetota bacterium]